MKKILFLPFLLAVSLFFSCKQKDKQPVKNLMPNVSHFITLDTALSMVARYKQNQDSILNGKFQGRTDVLLNCETFNRSAFDQLLALDSCEGVRIYYGMNANKAVVQIAVGVGSRGQDLYPTQNGIEGAAEMAQQCTVNCSEHPPFPGPRLFRPQSGN